MFFFSSTWRIKKLTEGETDYFLLKSNQNMQTNNKWFGCEKEAEVISRNVSVSY